MGRLIDADVLKNVFDPNTWQGETLRTVIDNSPTAYDVDKVVDEIKSLSGIQFDGQNESYQLDWCISTDKTIDIVKGVVKDE